MKAMTDRTWKCFSCPAASRVSSVTNHLKSINPPEHKTSRVKMLLYLSLSDKWWLLVWGCISNYFSVASPVGPVTRAASEGRRGECKTACVIFGSRAPPAFDVWSSRASPQLQYVWVVFLAPFCCAGCNVMYCQTGTRRKVNAGFWNPYCQLLSAKPPWQAVRCGCALVLQVSKFFLGGGDPSGVWTSMEKTQRNAPVSPVSAQKCTGAPHDSSLVPG